MASVTKRISEIKQPRGGYIKPSEFETIIIDDGIALNEKENIHGSIIGLTVDYLTRFCMGTEIQEAFKISLLGATIAYDLGLKEALNIAENLLGGIKGLDNESITNACKLVTFDIWKRNLLGATMAKNYKEINPDKSTMQNIQTFVKRSVTFFEKYGPVTDDGFTFGPVIEDASAYEKMLKTGNGSYGGYTAIVNSGDGDFLAVDTLWDFKVSKTKPTNKQTLQLLMYWIMGQHSGQEKFRNITKLGIFNPRLNTVYLLHIKNIPEDIIKTVEKEVICYK